MSENHQVPELLSPAEALPRYHEDTDEQLIAREIYKRQVVQRLESLDESSMSFEGTGEVEVTLRVGGKIKVVSLPIKSLSAQLMEEISKAYQKCASKIPRSWNEKSGEWDEEKGKFLGGWDQDPSHPRFAEIAEQLTEVTRRLNYDKLLHGLDIPIKDRHGNVVWSQDEDGPRDKDAAMQAIRRMGIREEDIEKIVSAIDSLTLEVEADDEEDYLKKSLLP